MAHARAKFGLKPQLDDERAADLMLTLAGTAVYRSLVLDYGWPRETFVSWLEETLDNQLTSAGAPSLPAPGQPGADVPARS